jgi:hypothetical protein
MVSPLNHLPPSQSPFSLKYKQNMKFRRDRFDILVTEICLVCESYVLSFIFNAKHCIVNTLLDFKHIFCIFELLEGSAKQVSDHNRA